jgi:hypothetical protein
MSNSNNNSSGTINYIPYNIITIPNNWNTYNPWQPVAAQPAAKCQPSEKKKDKDGCTCKNCKEFYPYAEPNQEDGTLICYGCRMEW